MKKIIIIFLIILSLFLRFYNLEFTARFTRDESSDLVNIKNIYQNKKITLIGPRSEGGLSVFSSLTYYLLLPFCILFNFDPLASVYGTAFYGFLATIAFGLVLKKTHWSYLVFILAIIFTPFLESSRWAWNPHLIPFWQSLTLLILVFNFPFKYFIWGLLMGLTIHQHWFAVFTVLSIIPIIFILNKKFKVVWQYLLGVFFSIFPFILFDLTHPPGLFITRMLYFSPLSNTAGKINFFSNFWQNTISVFQYFSGNQLTFGVISLILTLLIFIQYRTKNNLWLLPLLFQITGLSLTHSQYANRYLLPAAIFYLFWLSKSQKFFLAKFLTILLVVFNLSNLLTILNYSDWSSNIQAQKQIVNFISQNQKNDSSYNLIVLQSPDGNTKGLRFKDQLILKNISPKNEDDYQNINTLYTITYQSDWTKLSPDPAYELDNFRTGKPVASVNIPGSDWIVYKLSKNSR